MRTKQERIDKNIMRLERLKQETILKFTEEIDFEQTLSLYDTMMEHFVNGELDDVFITDVTSGMSKDERDTLFKLAREFQGLCFYKGDPDYWLDSLEDIPVHDYSFVAYSILDNFNFLLEIAKDGGRDVLELLVSLRANEELRDAAIVEYLRTTFIDDRVLVAILYDMAQEDSLYNIFTDDQKGILLNYPDGTLYSYANDDVRITSPLVLGAKIFNKVNAEEIVVEVEDNDVEPLVLTLSDFFREEYFDFYDEVLILADRYRDYMRKNEISFNSEYPNIIFDTESDMIQAAWLDGDEVLGGTYDTPYSGGTK